MFKKPFSFSDCSPFSQCSPFSLPSLRYRPTSKNSGYLEKLGDILNNMFVSISNLAICPNQHIDNMSRKRMPHLISLPTSREITRNLRITHFFAGVYMAGCKLFNTNGIKQKKYFLNRKQYISPSLTKFATYFFNAHEEIT